MVICIKRVIVPNPPSYTWALPLQLQCVFWTNTKLVGFRVCIEHCQNSYKEVGIFRRSELSQKGKIYYLTQVKSTCYKREWTTSMSKNMLSCKKHSLGYWLRCPEIQDGSAYHSWVLLTQNRQRTKSKELMAWGQDYQTWTMWEQMLWDDPQMLQHMQRQVL